MRKTGWVVLAVLLAGLSSPVVDARAAESEFDDEPLFPVGGIIRLVSGMFQVGGVKPEKPIQPEKPVQPEQPIQPPGAVPTPPPGAAPPYESVAMLTPEQREERIRQMISETRAPAAQGATGADAAIQGGTDTAQVLSQAGNVQNVEVQRRNPVTFDPHIRGYKAGQIYAQANGVYWMSARPDLDTMLNKIDPGMVQDVVVLPGPYGLRYGPGFAFVDVERAPTERHADGFQAHFDTSGNLRTNGGQLYGRETIFGGSRDWGFRFSYGNRKGSDYEAGNDLKIPSSYHNQDFWGEVSYDINPYQHVDFAFQRLDQTNTEYPGQFFDIDFLATYGLETQVVDEDPSAPWSKLVVGTWYNRTRFAGDTSGKTNPLFPVLNRVNVALDHEFGDPVGTNHLNGNTVGGLSTSGVRAAVSFGEPDEGQLTIGTDFRYLTQVLREFFSITGPSSPIDFSTNMPHAWMADPGLYAEWSRAFTEAWTLSLGGRVDFTRTTARAGDLRPEFESSLPGWDEFLTQDDILYAFYLSNKLKLNEHWTLSGGLGHAQRPPTLIERYADGLFLSLMQSGFTRVIGDPRLRPERDWQVDVGLGAEYEKFRGRANYFYAWVEDYVTFFDDTVIEFSDARLLRYMNTGLATLTGFEWIGEYDLAPRLSPFAKMSYVEGRDQTLGAPLPMIPPLESTVGLRLHDPDQGRRWGIELAARMVHAQHRLGTIRLGGVPEVVEEATPGFTVWSLRGYYNFHKNLNVVAGIDNLFDRTYQEHLDLRLLGPDYFPGPPTRVLEPGFTPYLSVRWIF